MMVDADLERLAAGARWPRRAPGDDGPRVRVLVTGADGFVGRHLVRHLLRSGDDVAAACRPGGAPVDWSAGVAGGAGWRRSRSKSSRRRPSPRRWPGVRRRSSISRRSPPCARPARPRRGVGRQRGRHGAARGRRGAPAGGQDAHAAGDLDRRGLRGRHRRAARPRPIRCGPCRPTRPARSARRRRRSRPGGAPASRSWSRARFRIPGRGRARSTWCRRSRRGSATPGGRRRARCATGNLEPVRDLLDVRDVGRRLPACCWRAGRPGRRTTSPGARGRAGRGVPAARRDDRRGREAGDRPLADPGDRHPAPGRRLD